MKRALSFVFPLVILYVASAGAQSGVTVTKFDVAGIPVIHKPVTAN